MSQPDFFNDQITILRAPSWLGRGVHEERELPLTPGDYKVTPGERWAVTSLTTNEVIYDGIGPVEILREPTRRLSADTQSTAGPARS